MEKCFISFTDTLLKFMVDNLSSEHLKTENVNINSIEDSQKIEIGKNLFEMFKKKYGEKAKNLYAPLFIEEIFGEMEKVLGLNLKNDYMPTGLEQRWLNHYYQGFTNEFVNACNRLS